MNKKAKKVEFDYACQACKATGLYSGMAERDGAAVVCHDCNGTGKARFEFEYTEFTGRKPARGVKQVFEKNVGIIMGTDRGEQLPDFGGMPYGEWTKGKPFVFGMENRNFTCPAWWYQGDTRKLKPEWKECVGWGGTFSACEHFVDKAKCWERWDNEFGLLNRRMK